MGTKIHTNGLPSQLSAELDNYYGLDFTLGGVKYRVQGVGLLSDSSCESCSVYITIESTVESGTLLLEMDDVAFTSR